MPVVGVVVNSQKEKAKGVAEQMAKWLAAKGVNMGIPLTDITELVCEPPTNLDQLLKGLDWIVVLGGDGTLLNAARLVAPYNIPLLGVNLGRLGFLTEVEEDGLFPSLERLLAGDYLIEERMMLQARVISSSGVQRSFLALNDVVVTKGSFARMINLRASVGEELIGTYSADGILVASPTGSTAYSLSAGGPILVPDMHALIITPICSHAIDTRPLVVSDNKQISIQLTSRNLDVKMTVDGHSGIKLKEDDLVIVSKAQVVAKLIRFDQYKFFHILSEKMRKGR